MLFEAPHRIAAALQELAARLRRRAPRRRRPRAHEACTRASIAARSRSWPRARRRTRTWRAGKSRWSSPARAAAGEGDAALLARALPLLLRELAAGARGGHRGAAQRRAAPAAYEQALRGRDRRRRARPRRRILCGWRAGQAIAASFTGGGGKSGLGGSRCQVTPGGREPTESATESKPPKRRQRRWQG